MEDVLSGKIARSRERMRRIRQRKEKSLPPAHCADNPSLQAPVHEKNYGPLLGKLWVRLWRILRPRKPDRHDFGDGKPVPAHRHPFGGGWVAETAEVEPTAFVGRDAAVFGAARVRGAALIGGTAKIHGRAIVAGDAKVCGQVEVFDLAVVSGAAEVSGSARIFGKALLRENARVFENATVCGEAAVSGNARVMGEAVVEGHARIEGNYILQGARRIDGKTRLGHVPTLSVYRHKKAPPPGPEKSRLPVDHPALDEISAMDSWL